MTIIPYEPDHLLQIQHLQPGQDPAFLTETIAETLALGHAASTCLVEDHIMACAGLMPLWRGRMMAWAVLDARTGPWILEITRAMRAELDRCPAARVEMYVKPGFWQAVRWAHMLGFCYESCMEAGHPATGGDLWVFKRINDVRTPAVRKLSDGICNVRPGGDKRGRRGS